MSWNQKPCFRFEIDNFSEKKDAISSQTFVSGGYEWYLHLYPEGDYLSGGDHLPLYLAADSKSLGSGGERMAMFYFSLLNQSDKELYRSPIGQTCYFGVKYLSWGCATLPLSKLQEEGYLEMDRLIIEVYIKVVDAVDGEGGDAKKKETVDFVGHQDYASQVALVRKILEEPREVAEEFKPKKVLNALRNAYSKVSELVAEAKLQNWFKSKFGEFSSESKKADDELARVPLMTKKDADDTSRVQHLEERIKNLELLESGSQMDSLKSKLEEISLEKKNSYDAYGSLVQQLEERVKNLELSLKSKLEEVSLEKKKSEADGFKVQQLLEDRVKNLELMVSDLKVELDKEKAKSSVDGFLLVD
ncbi:MATH domain and coiled-coil domain-containing protein At2g42480-like [Capsella rubella]|uniref:MATH domain and coiled-coil domain-containing protein At2g42480-like n=1 Tax=Capsella rubella TaxID=81985 RepID=UPI000CD5031B|nr:MATH domain and coiled-coil domain-containing protein At2g42480-like [Capsella rubella]